MLACIGTLVFQCLPVNAAWSFTLRESPTTKCYSVNTFRAIGLFNGCKSSPETLLGLFRLLTISAINIFTDFVFATLPIPVIWPLQINMRTKISLLCILSLGYLYVFWCAQCPWLTKHSACAASIVKEVLLSTFFTNEDVFL